jgi:hypothetical protein
MVSLFKFLLFRKRHVFVNGNILKSTIAGAFLFFTYASVAEVIFRDDFESGNASSLWSD